MTTDKQKYVGHVSDLMNRSLFTDISDSYEVLYLLGLVMDMLDNQNGYTVNEGQTLMLQRAWAYLLIIKKKDEVEGEPGESIVFATVEDEPLIPFQQQSQDAHIRVKTNENGKPIGIIAERVGTETVLSMSLETPVDGHTQITSNENGELYGKQYWIVDMK